MYEGASGLTERGRLRVSKPKDNNEGKVNEKKNRAKEANNNDVANLIRLYAIQSIPLAKSWVLGKHRRRNHEGERFRLMQYVEIGPREEKDRRLLPRGQEGRHVFRRDGRYGEVVEHIPFVSVRLKESW